MPNVVLMKTERGDGYVNLSAAFAFEVAQTSAGGWAAYAKFGSVNGTAEPSASPDCIEIAGTYSHSRAEAMANLEAFLRGRLKPSFYVPAN